jgi:hypothetical protein
MIIPLQKLAKNGDSAMQCGVITKFRANDADGTGWRPGMLVHVTDNRRQYLLRSGHDSTTEDNVFRAIGMNEPDRAHRPHVDAVIDNLLCDRVSCVSKLKELSESDPGDFAERTRFRSWPAGDDRWKTPTRRLDLHTTYRSAGTFATGERYGDMSAKIATLQMPCLVRFSINKNSRADSGPKILPPHHRNVLRVMPRAHRFLWREEARGVRRTIRADQEKLHLGIYRWSMQCGPA